MRSARGANAGATVWQYTMNSAEELARLRSLANECADAALALDPNIGAAYWAKGIVNDPSRTFAQREGLLKKSLAVDPQFLPSRNWYADLLRSMGRMRESRVYYERLFNEDPIAPAWARIGVSSAAAQLGRSEEGARRSSSGLPSYGLSRTRRSRGSGPSFSTGTPRSRRSLGSTNACREHSARGAEDPAALCISTFLEARTGAKAPH